MKNKYFTNKSKTITYVISQAAEHLYTWGIVDKYGKERMKAKNTCTEWSQCYDKITELYGEIIQVK